MANVEVHQVTSLVYGNYVGWASFINIEEKYGYVSAWGSAYGHATYFLRNGIRWMVVQFDSKEFEDAWMSEELQYWEICIDLVNNKVIKNEAK